MLGTLRGLTFDDVVLVPGYNGIRSRQNVTTTVELKKQSFAIPIISSNMDTITGLDMANAITALGGMAILHRFMSVDDNVAMFKKVKVPEKVAVSIGVGKEGAVRGEALIAAGATIICVDVAHGHSKEVNRTVRTVRETHGNNVMIIAGNVATYAGADYLAAAGADVIKVGIGNGSVCTTRITSAWYELRIYGVPGLGIAMGVLVGPAFTNDVPNIAKNPLVALFEAVLSQDITDLVSVRGQIRQGLIAKEFLVMINLNISFRFR